MSCFEATELYNSHWMHMASTSGMPNELTKEGSALKCLLCKEMDGDHLLDMLAVQRIETHEMF